MSSNVWSLPSLSVAPSNCFWSWSHRFVTSSSSFMNPNMLHAWRCWMRWRWVAGERCRADLRSSLCLAFCEKWWLWKVDTKCSAPLCPLCLLMWCMEIESNLLVERNYKTFKHILNSFIQSCFIVLSCCSVIFLRFQNTGIIYFSRLLLIFCCGLLFCIGQPAVRYVPCTSCQDTLHPDSKSCPYPGNFSCHPRGG